jgi:hypothetical protein
MTQLRSCYFCGTTGALSAYATLPETLRGDDERSRRVVLCSGCHTKLTNILTPIVDRLQREADGEPPDRTGNRSDRSTAEAGGTASPSTPTAQPEVTFSGSAARDETTEPEPRRESAAEVEPTRSDDAETDDADSGASTPEAGRSEAPDVASGSEPVGPSESPETDAPDDATDTGSEAPSPSDASESPTASTEVSDRLERVYHQLLRFLRNREFPIPRSEAELIAQSAYDLSAAEASEVIQLTVDRDVLEERGGELHRR